MEDMVNDSNTTKRRRRPRQSDGSSDIHPGVEIRTPIQIYEDASGAPAVLAYRGFVFSFDTLGETRLRLISGDGTTGTRIQSKVARDLCLHAYLTLLHAAVSEDWRERNVRLYDDVVISDPAVTP